MIDDRELWACANPLIRQHGSGAWPFATLRAKALLDAGDVAGNGVFLAIRDRIEQLEALDSEGKPH
jgi:hypothetical protein